MQRGSDQLCRWGLSFFLGWLTGGIYTDLHVVQFSRRRRRPSKLQAFSFRPLYSVALVFTVLNRIQVFLFAVKWVLSVPNSP